LFLPALPSCLSAILSPLDDPVPLSVLPRRSPLAVASRLCCNFREQVHCMTLANGQGDPRRLLRGHPRREADHGIAMLDQVHGGGMASNTHSSQMQKTRKAMAPVAAPTRGFRGTLVRHSPNPHEREEWQSDRAR